MFSVLVTLTGTAWPVRRSDPCPARPPFSSDVRRSPWVPVSREPTGHPARVAKQTLLGQFPVQGLHEGGSGHLPDDPGVRLSTTETLPVDALHPPVRSGAREHLHIYM